MLDKVVEPVYNRQTDKVTRNGVALDGNQSSHGVALFNKLDELLFLARANLACQTSSRGFG